MESVSCCPLTKSGINILKLKDYLMKKAGLFTTAALAGLFAFAVNDNANAQQIAANTKPVVNTNSYSVGVMDLRDKDLKAVDAIAARASIGSIIVYYMGDDVNLMNKVREGASQAKDAGAPVKGMILAKPDMSFEGGKDSFLIMLDGIPVNKQADASIYPIGTPRKLIEWAVETFGEEIGITSVADKKDGLTPEIP
ncbi:hypothetical protein QQ020_26055 [Fulvivirgaceae bacterium BMA12]|uniref:Uncharacterized protein n=1 Tax=Agaribacillus aureus TaxID=3051825 RepID=A0ABT8LH07_9BACT|nr:hypothetical protein [Fulvivirgaceae bacterium BMA12]